MTTDPVIRVSVKEHEPFSVAQKLYAKWSKIPFEDDLADYLRTGCVLSLPTCFGMAKIIDLAPYQNGVRIGKMQPAWFVRCAVGQIWDLLIKLPCFLPQICFCRRGEDKLRVYDMKRFLQVLKSTRKIYAPKTMQTIAS
jgi:hypothetical protein